MRTMLVVGAAVLALAGCTEVTRFRQADGSDIYLADCDSNLRLQSCRAALDSTCPGGYDLVRPAMRREGDTMVATQSPYFTCR